MVELCTMKNLLITCLIATSLIWIACSEAVVVTVKTSSEALLSEIIISRVMPKGGELLNEFGNQADWLELYNTSNHQVQLSEGEWFLSDDPENDPDKFELPGIELSPGEHMLIWCDGENIVANAIHTNFKLSSKGETLRLSRQSRKGEYVLADQFSYGPVTQDGHSIIRPETAPNTRVGLETEASTAAN
jgi:hypothetical protein